LEGYNRAVFGFNEGTDKAIVKPAASGYKSVMPKAARTSVSDFGRFGMNSTVGILGLFEVASTAGLEKHNEEFGQTYVRDAYLQRRPGVALQRIAGLRNRRVLV
jgi:phospholipid-binding lipoprotein MlaA